eukprot:2675091-Prymnesium_polylepis.2
MGRHAHDRVRRPRRAPGVRWRTRGHLGRLAHRHGRPLCAARRQGRRRQDHVVGFPRARVRRGGLRDARRVDRPGALARRRARRAPRPVPARPCPPRSCTSMHACPVREQAAFSPTHQLSRGVCVA